MILGGETEVRGGNPPFPKVLYETLGRVEPDRSVSYAVALHNRLFNSSTLYPGKP